MEIKSLKRDSTAIAAGTWVTEIPGMDDLKLRVRGLSSPVAVALRSRLERKVPREKRLSDGSIKPEVSRAILGQVLVETVLLDWGNLTSDGKDIPYDKDFAAKMLSDPDHEPFADAVTWSALFVDRGGTEAQETLEKNSKRPSAGSSGGAQ